MRRAIVAVVLAWAGLVTPFAADGSSPVEFCREAFLGEPPLDETQPLETLLEQVRQDAPRKFDLLRQASDRGHLPSLYLLSTFFREGMRPEGAPGEEERAAAIERLAEATFPPAEERMAARTRYTAFFGNWFDPGSDQHSAAVARWEYFTWMKRAALHGERSAWEKLADHYPYVIERFGGGSEERIEVYAWSHLRASASDGDSDYTAKRWKQREREAWEALEGKEERARARERARQYVGEVLPRLVQVRAPQDICALEPQFHDDTVEARRIHEPFGPRPEPPDPSEPRAYPPVPFPEAPAGLTVVTGSAQSDGEPIEVLRVPDGAGTLHRAVCAVRRAHVFENGRRLRVETSIEGPGGEELPLCRDVSDRRVLRRHDPAVEGLRVYGGERVMLGCFAAGPQYGARASTPCTVEVQLWIRPAS